MKLLIPENFIEIWLNLLCRPHFHVDLYYKYSVLYWSNPGSKTLRNTSCTATNLSSHKQTSKMNKTCGTERERQGYSCDILLWTPTHGHTRDGRLERTYSHLPCAETWMWFRRLPRYNYTYTYTCRNIINNNDERTHFFRKIYLSHFILERVVKGLMFVMCERWVRDGDRLQHIDPKVFSRP